MPRLIVLAAAVLCALFATGCGNKHGAVTTAHTEGIYLDVDELKYQIQISRSLNPDDIEDQAYLRGLPEGTAPPAADETWFGVFIRVSNGTDEEITPANDFQIVDTQENVYRPIPLDPEVNDFAYVPEPIGPKSMIPAPDSIASEGVIQGSLLLFKVKTDSLQNRPLEFKFRRGSGVQATVDLDI